LHNYNLGTPHPSFPPPHLPSEYDTVRTEKRATWAESLGSAGGDEGVSEGGRGGGEPPPPPPAAPGGGGAMGDGANTDAADARWSAG